MKKKSYFYILNIVFTFLFFTMVKSETLTELLYENAVKDRELGKQNPCIYTKIQPQGICSPQSWTVCNTTSSTYANIKNKFENEIDLSKYSVGCTEIYRTVLCVEALKPVFMNYFMPWKMCVDTLIEFQSQCPDLFEYIYAGTFDISKYRNHDCLTNNFGIRAFGFTGYRTT